MPVDRQMFETVRQRVIDTAPPGLSREQFDALLDQELAKVEPSQPPQQPTDSHSRIMGRLDQMEARGTELQQEAVEHPVRTAADIAMVAAVPAAGRAIKAAKPWIWPTRAAAGAKFQQVMGAAKNAPVDTSGAEQVASRIWDLAGGMGKVGRGGSMPKPVSDFIKRMTDPNQGPLLYQEARDFASNLGRLSAKDWSSVNPVIGAEIHKLRIALNAAVGKTATSVGQGEAYHAAMREYARAARNKELATKAAKYGAGVVGAGWLYNELAGR